MWILRYIYCLLKGHSMVYITSSERPYRYCLRCGQIKEPLSILKRHTGEPVSEQSA